MRKRNVLKDERAVSPVIATILLVAITVVLAATLYMMLPDSEDQEKLLAAEFSADYEENEDGTTLTVKVDTMVAPNSAEQRHVEFYLVGTEDDEQIFGNDDKIEWSYLNQDDEVRGGSEAVIDWDENDLGEPDRVVIFIDGYEGSRSVNI